MNLKWLRLLGPLLVVGGIAVVTMGLVEAWQADKEVTDAWAEQAVEPEGVPTGVLVAGGVVMLLAGLACTLYGFGRPAAEKEQRQMLAGAPTEEARHMAAQTEQPDSDREEK